jgi:hypothetical protein
LWGLTQLFLEGLIESQRLGANAMKFKATKIATAVAAGLSISAMGMNVAKADSIFFPYFAISPTVTTLLSVINDDIEAETLSELHYRYYRNDGAGACTEFNFWNNTSANDIVTFDLGGVFSGDDPQGVLFEPTRTQAIYQDDFAVMGKSAGIKRGYVLVDNAPRNPADPVPAPTAQMAGEAFLIEFQTGSAWGYRAYNASEIWGLTVPPDTGDLVLLNQYDFSDRVEQNGEVLTAPPAATVDSDQKANFWSPIAVAPWTEGVTAFFVTPVGTTPPFQGPNGTSSLTATIELRATAQGADRVLFNRDERAFSGSQPKAVTCVGKVLIEDLVDELVVQSTPQGGWTNLAIRPAATGTTSQAVVLKASYNPEDPSSLNGVAINGSYNNVNWLRKGIRESSGRPLVADGWAALPIFSFPGIDNNAPFPVLLANRRATATITGEPLPPPPGRATLPYYDPNIFAPPLAVAAAISDGRVFIGSSGL